MSTEYRYATVSELGSLLRSRQVSSIDLTRAALDLLSSEGSRLNVVAGLTADRALAEAAQADRELAEGIDRGPLHGIPYGAKDLLDTADIATEYGSPTHQGRVPAQDAVAIRLLQQAGAVLAAKVTMIPLAGGGGYPSGSVSLGGPVRNPWNLDRWAGGSSSGSGAAVAAGLLPYSIGSETWGSIVCPASFCGVSGLRPTYGRVPSGGAMILSWTLDKLGPLARTAEDCGTVLAGLSGMNGLDPSFLPSGYSPVTGTRIGVLPENYAAYADPEIEPALRTALDSLRTTGVVLNDVTLPEYPYGAIASLICTVEGTASFDDLNRSPRLRELTSLEQQSGMLAGLGVPAVDYIRAQRLRAAMQDAFATLFQHVDILVAPSFLRIAPRVDQNLNETISGGNDIEAAGNLCGLPCLSVPMGFGQEGMPVGLQIVGPAGGERHVLDVAIAFQQVTDWHTRQPPV